MLQSNKIGDDSVLEEQFELFGNPFGISVEVSMNAIFIKFLNYLYLDKKLSISHINLVTFQQIYNLHAILRILRIYKKHVRTVQLPTADSFDSANSFSTLGILHTNLASINKYHDDLSTVLSLLKPEIHVIGISEHKIHSNDTNNTRNINLEGYHPFVFDPTETTHGGTGFYIKDSLVFKKRDDLKFNSSCTHESTFIEIILPNKKNIILGCIYRHPNSKIPVNCFIDNYIESLLDKLSTEDKLISLMGDFNIDLLKNDSNHDVNSFYNIMASHFFAPYGPSRLSSNTLIDNIFTNSVEYLAHSGNLTIQIADQPFQFVLLEGFFKDLVQKIVNLYERNLKIFVDREFIEALSDINWDEILLINENDPNVAINNFHRHINYLLDELALYKKLSKKELKVKSKPWINNLILIEINKRDKLLHKYSKMKNKDSDTASIIFDKYKKIRNIVTKLKRDSKLEYYHKFLKRIKRKAQRSGKV